MGSTDSRSLAAEQAFGIIKSVMDFSPYSLRGLRKATGELNLVRLSCF